MAATRQTVWVVPGSHDIGNVEILVIQDDAGSNRLPGAVPLICGPADLVINNRQTVHGAFANTSKNVRVTIDAGFHRRISVLDVTSGGVKD